MTVTTETGTVPAARLRGWDCVEFWVGTARAMAGFLMSAFGFRCTAYAGPETGVRDKAALAGLPAEEGGEWGKLWAEVAALLARAGASQ